MTARSISPASRTLTGLTSTPNDGAAVWIAPNWPMPEVMAGSRMTAARVMRGAISLSSSSHFPLITVFEQRKTGGVATGPRQALDEARADRIGDMHEHDRHGAGRLQQRPQRGAASGQDDVRCERDQFRRVSANAISIARAPAVFDPHVAADAPAQLLQPLRERGDADGSFRIVGSHAHQHADAPHPLALLRPRRERPRRRRAAEQRDELAPLLIRSPRRRGRAERVGY